MSIAHERSGCRIRSHGHSRTLRLPDSLGTPNLSNAIGVAGFNTGVEGNYVHLTGSSAWFTTGTNTPQQAYLFDANGRLDNWRYEAASRQLTFSLAAHQPLVFRMAQLEPCQIKANDRAISPSRSETLNGVKVQQFRLKDAAAKIQVSCPTR